MKVAAAPVLRRSVPLPLSPAPGPPTDWGELVQMHNDRDVLQASHDELTALALDAGGMTSQVAIRSERSCP